MSDVPVSRINWRHNLYAIFITELVAMAGFSVVGPILPLYIRDLGVQSEDAVRLWSGIIFSAPAVTMTLASPIWGALSDRHGRKVMVVRAMFAGAVLIALAGFAQNVQQLAVLRAIQGMLTGTVTAATTLVATTVPRQHAGYALGMLQMAIYAGASVGPVLGGLVADSLGYRAAFYLTAVLLFISALGVMFFVREDFHPPVRDESQAHPSVRLGLRARVRRYGAPVLGSAALISVLGVSVLVRLGGGLISSVLALFVESIAVPGARVASLSGLVSGVSAAGGAVGALLLGRLGDRHGHRPMLIVCSLVSALCYTLQSFARSPAQLVVLQALTGLSMGGILASLSAALARLAPAGQEGVVYGINSGVASAANAVAPLTGSALAVWLGLRVPFLVAAGSFLLSGGAAARFLPSEVMTDSTQDEARARAGQSDADPGD